MARHESELSAQDDALAQLLRRLKAAAYQFTAVTPATHQRVLARPFSGKAKLRDIFGWNRPFNEGDLDPALLDLMRAADILERHGAGWRSQVRVASLGPDLFLHSAFPTDDPDSVFFGPDTYRFVRFIGKKAPGLSGARRVVDLGAGSGAGGIAAAKLIAGAQVTLVDPNGSALRLARINAAVAGAKVEILHQDRLPPAADLVIANPPYMMDSSGRTYRDGGDLLGGAIPLDWARQALDTMSPGGTLLLYTGAAVADGKAPLVAALRELCASHGAAIDVDEMDPDVFGEELEEPPYAQVDRIAALAIVIVKPT